MTQTRSCGKRPSVALSGALAGLFAVALILGGCVGTADSTASEQDLQSAHSTETSDDYPMSGEYRIGPDGHLLQPERFLQEPILQSTARQQTPAGAASFARYWVKVLEYSWNTGDATILSAISTDDCIMCQDAIRMVREYYADGLWALDFKYVTTQTEEFTPHPDRANCLVGIVHVTERPAHFYNGKTVVETPENKALIEMHLCQVVDGWQTCGGGTFKDVGQ